MMLFKDFIQKRKMKKATSNIKIYQGISSILIDNVDKNLRDRPFSSDVGTVFLHPSRGTPWVE